MIRRSANNLRKGGRGKIGGERNGFSLAEAVLALALFSISAFMVSQVCYNSVYPLVMEGENPELEADIRKGVEAVLGVSDYDSLSDEIDIDAFDGDIYKVSGEAQSTPITDLFELVITVRGKSFEAVRRMFVVRPGWYEISTERDDIVEDRTDYLDESRREAAR